MKVSMLQVKKRSNIVVDALQQRKEELLAELTETDRALGRSEEVGAAQWGGNCRDYGCNKGYQKWQSCQCTSTCNKHGNCCSDYSSTCHKAAPEPVTQISTTAVLPTFIDMGYN